MTMLQQFRAKLANRVDPLDRAKKRFLRFFPMGFKDPKYYAWERGYKWDAHVAFRENLGKNRFETLLKKRRYKEIAATCIRLESRTNLLFSFEKMAIRDAVRTPPGARVFSEGLYQLLHGYGSIEGRFQLWCDAVEALPRKQTRVLTHPIVTVFPFIADPRRHIFLKPMVTRMAAARLGIDLYYHSRPSWDVYSELLALAEKIRNGLVELDPRDMIDIQSFIWVAGSEEYE